MWRLVGVFVLVAAAVAHKQLLSRYAPGGRIVGGTDADIKDYSYQVALSDGSVFCGGTILDPSWVLTAAHCTYFSEASDFVVQANTSESEGGENRTIDQIIQHPDFNYITADSDLSLLKLSAPLNCANCRPIRLSKAAPVVGENVTVTGWGITISDYDYNTDGSPLLQVARIPVVDTSVCEEAYGKIGLTVSTNMLCAGYMETGGVDACLGDSGGPATYQGELVGVVSWGVGCAEPGYLGVYALVPNFIDWIAETTGISVD